MAIFEGQLLKIYQAFRFSANAHIDTSL